jgi:hypothetical protein
MVFKIFQKRLPDGFGFARDDGVAVELRLVGQDGGMDAPQNDRFSPFHKLRRDLLRPVGRRRHAGDRDEVARHIVIDVLDLLLDDDELMFFRCHGRDIKKRDHWETNDIPRLQVLIFDGGNECNFQIDPAFFIYDFLYVQSLFSA